MYKVSFSAAFAFGILNFLVLVFGFSHSLLAASSGSAFLMGLLPLPD